MFKHKNLLGTVSLLSLFLLLSVSALANNTPQQEEVQETVILKVSKETLASLETLLTQEQFALLEERLIGQDYTKLDLSALKTVEMLVQEKATAEAAKAETTPTSDETQDTSNTEKPEAQTPATSTIVQTEPRSDTLTEAQIETIEKQAQEEGVVVFSQDEIEKIQNSIHAYLDLLTKIQHVAPLIKSADETKTQIEKLEAGIETLMKDQKTQVEAELVELREQFNVDMSNFKQVAHHFDFKSINFDKLPGMITDLGYEDSFYDIIFSYLSEYIGLIKKVATASSIAESQTEVASVIKEKEKELSNAKTSQEKATIEKELEELVKRKNTLKHEFTLNATGIDTDTLEQKDTKKLSVEAELTKVFSPLIVGLTEFTEPSRRIEFLRSHVAYYEQNTPKIRDGLKQVETLLVDTKNEVVKQGLLKEQAYWQQQEKEFNTKLQVAKQQLIEIENRKLSAVDAFNQFMQAVFSKRGLNIVLSIVFFFATFVILMFLRRLILLINPFSYIPRLRFVANIIDVLLYLFTFIIATLVLMVSLFAAGEVLALALVTIVLLGMGWALRNTLPQFVEQIKLLIGYGTVRQGEKVIYEGIAWEVESIGIYSYLINPFLTGGRVRLPIRDLIDLRSRPFGEKENLFPCKEGDYILINQKNWRRIITQTPQSITFDWHGMEESMQTREFVEQNIVNLSKTPFWLMGNLDIAYHHRFKLTNEITTKLTAYLEEEFKKTPYAEHLVLAWVGFGGMTDTSLKLYTWLRVQPEAAEKYSAMHVVLNKICLNAANHYGWDVVRFHAIQQQALTPPTVPDVDEAVLLRKED